MMYFALVVETNIGRYEFDSIQLVIGNVKVKRVRLIEAGSLVQWVK
jgi:hypothetical protein